MDRVFGTVAHIEGFSKAVPDIVKVEFLNLLIKGFLTKALASDMDAVKRYCEE